MERNLVTLQIFRGSRFSMVSLNESSNMMSLAADHSVALYRGVTVVVYKVNKTEINLTRDDLIELINVSSSVVVLTALTRDQRHNLKKNILRKF